MMCFAKPGQGKFSLNIEFGHYLANQHNKKVLFVADEEKKGYTLQEKLKRLKAVLENFYISEELPKSLKGFDFVFMDSENIMGLTADELKTMRLKYPNISFIPLKNQSLAYIRYAQSARLFL